MTKYLYIVLLSLIAFVAPSYGRGGEEQNENMENVAAPALKKGPRSVLILSSSPRRGGNSEMLCEQFRKGAEEARWSGAVSAATESATAAI